MIPAEGTSAPKSAVPEPPRKRPLSGVLTAGLIALVLSVYAWTLLGARPYSYDFPDARKAHYYNLLVDAFLHGHLYLDTPPRKALLDSPNPYDPAQRQRADTPHDVALYQGKFYIYFGPAPAVVLFLPWRLLTHQDVTAKAAVFIFTGGGFLLSVLLWLSVRKRYFPHSDWLALFCGIPALGLLNISYAVLRRPSIWEVCIASGYCFLMGAFACLPGIIANRKPALRMALAGLLVGLAVASRPTYALTGPLFLIALYGLWKAQNKQSGSTGLPGRCWWLAALSGATTLGAILAGLLWYNYERFGRLLEFGLKYNLTATDESHVEHFGLKFISTNFSTYFFSLPDVSRFFPFLSVPFRADFPPGYLGVEQVIGLFPSNPFLLLIFLAPFGVWLTKSAAVFELKVLMGAIAAAAGFICLFEMCFCSAVVRYMFDFVPSLILLAAFGLLAAENLTQGGYRRRLIRWLLSVGTCASLTVAILLNFTLFNNVRLSDPYLYAHVAWFFDRPVLALEKALGHSYTALEIDLKLPMDKAGKIEPLLTTGWESAIDCLFIRYGLDNRHIMIGFEHAGRPALWSRPIVCDYTLVQTIIVDMGSFYPSKEPAPTGTTVIRNLKVTFDDLPVFNGLQPFYLSASAPVSIGSNAGAAGLTRFSGQVLAARPASQ